MMHRRSWYMSGIIASTIAVLVFLSVDISPYTNHHDKTPVGAVVQTFLTDVGLIT